ncbi:hypothetical protein GA0070216_12654 [Micromonospora matsumotoense]|uniref:Phage integrase family protein n=1 Tax=Micromonospora matsumotoense TaxID=121616 RepID=A0A1C5AT33_9ACTN|nr:hypothetical protein GA0070216_12654 [Micromonospora matsumotoense]
MCPVAGPGGRACARSWRGWGTTSPRAALIYQHANREADQSIADTIDKAVKTARRKPSKRKRATEGDGSAV